MKDGGGLVYKRGQMLSGLHVKILSGTCEWEDGRREQLHYRFSWTSQPRQLTDAQGGLALPFLPSRLPLHTPSLLSPLRPPLHAPALLTTDAFLL